MAEIMVGSHLRPDESPKRAHRAGPDPGCLLWRALGYGASVVESRILSFPLERRREDNGAGFEIAHEPLPPRK